MTCWKDACKGTVIERNEWDQFVRKADEWREREGWIENN